MQFVRHGRMSADPAQAAATRRQRSCDRATRTHSRNRTMSPAQAAVARTHQDTNHTSIEDNRPNQAGEQEAADWLELLQGVDGRVRRLEGQQRHTAQLVGQQAETIEWMKNEFQIDRNQVADDLHNTLCNEPDSFNHRFESIEIQ